MMQEFLHNSTFEIYESNCNDDVGLQQNYIISSTSYIRSFLSFFSLSFCNICMADHSAFSSTCSDVAVILQDL